MFVTVLLAILAIVILHFSLLHYGKVGRLINSIPGPQAFPIVGNMHSLQISSHELWTFLRSTSKQYYPIFRVWSFTFPFLNIRHPDDVETVLGNTKFIQKSEAYNLLKPWFNTGLLTSSGRKWQVRRKILTPAFHFNVLQEFVDIFNEEGDRLIELLKSEGGPCVKDLLYLFSEHTLNVICETAMGSSLKDKGQFQYKYRKAVHDMGKVLVYRFVRPWLIYNFVFNLVPQGWRQTKLLKILHSFTKQIIQERKEYHEQTDGQYLSFNDPVSEKNDRVDGIRKKRLAMLDLLLAAHRANQIDDEGIREEVDTFMFRGHDTTAMGICFAVMLLAEHKEIQDQARIEVTTVLNENGNKMTMAVLQKFTYLDRCIKETLRLYPSVPFISRAPETDVQLSSFMVPAETMVHVHIADVHRDPLYWPNPDVFDPDRFLPKNCIGRHPYAYVPFSAGPRNCIGQRFAMLEMKTTLGLLLNNFSFEPVTYLKDVKMNTDLVLRPGHPVRTKFIPLTC
ncbi:Cytochrome P450 4C1 [Habropoda laboriosa]|uniref:Cytochrome P450 4C1 n=1 Tax=Habropoda laboriosa TaxID=597456 RepID=A0A0L7R2Z5_9HYME|nr:PREDICTED: cytochrome P450 4C1-like [Habropoda laboriosa]KOC65199.1 Cytochrome P450 4C1 [Habropoda laboriosa]